MKVAVLDTVHPVLHEKLQAAGWFVLDRSTGFSEAEIQHEWPQYDGIIIRSRFQVDRRWLGLSNNLKFIGRSGAGLDCIDVAAAAEKGIRIFNSPEGNRDAVAEHAIGMLLALFNNILRAHTEVSQGTWKRQANTGMELAGKTVGIIGYGQMGSALAQRLAGFNCRILAYDKYKTGFATDKVMETGLEKIFSEAEVLSLHVPLTPETNGMVDLAWLENFSKPVYLINTARGKILKTADLLKAMENGTVAGACLDVLEYEELGFEALNQALQHETFEKLAALPNVLLSPHVAGVTRESYYKMASVLADKVIAAFVPA